MIAALVVVLVVVAYLLWRRYGGALRSGFTPAPGCPKTPQAAIQAAMPKCMQVLGALQSGDAAELSKLPQQIPECAEALRCVPPASVAQMLQQNSTACLHPAAAGALGDPRTAQALQQVAAAMQSKEVQAKIQAGTRTAAAVIEAIPALAEYTPVVAQWAAQVAQNLPTCAAPPKKTSVQHSSAAASTKL